jgi:hypothetical protein
VFVAIVVIWLVVGAPVLGWVALVGLAAVAAFLGVCSAIDARASGRSVLASLRAGMRMALTSVTLLPW